MWSEVKVTQSCPTLWPHGLFPWNSPGQNLEWVAVPFSRGSSHPRDRTQVSCIAGGFLTSWATRKEIVHVYISVWNNTGQVAYRRREIFISWIHKQGGICRHHCKTIWLKWISSRVTITEACDEETVQPFRQSSVITEFKGNMTDECKTLLSRVHSSKCQWKQLLPSDLIIIHSHAAFCL